MLPPGKVEENICENGEKVLLDSNYSPVVALYKLTDEEILKMTKRTRTKDTKRNRDNKGSSLEPVLKKIKTDKCPESVKQFVALLEKSNQISDENLTTCRPFFKKLCKECENLKKQRALDLVPVKYLNKLISLFDQNIKNSMEIMNCSDHNETEREKNLIKNISNEASSSGFECAFCILQVLTIPNVHPMLFNEDIIDRIFVFIKNYLKSKKEMMPKCQNILILLNELLLIKNMTDNSILKASSLGVYAFFNKYKESGSRLLTTIFSKYSIQRKCLLDEILNLNLKVQNKSQGEIAQLFLELIQSGADFDLQGQINEKSARCLIKHLKNLTSWFLTGLFKRKKIFESFLNHLLTLLNKPEWPGSEFVLNISAFTLISNLEKKSEINFKLINLEFLSRIVYTLKKEDKEVERGQNDLENIKKLVSNNDVDNTLKEALLKYHKSQGCSTIGRFNMLLWFEEFFHLANNCKSELHFEESNNDDLPVLDFYSMVTLTRYFSSQRPLFRSLGLFFKYILKHLAEESVLIRSKVIKCISPILEFDPEMLGVEEVRLGVNCSFLDSSISVREAVVDLVGKLILKNIKFAESYIDIMLSRILDVGVSVRKKVIKLFQDLTLHNFQLTPKVLAKTIYRINDEESVKKIVLGLFQKLWFLPSPSGSNINTKTEQLFKTVTLLDAAGIFHLETLFSNIFKFYHGTTVVASKEIVENMVENIPYFDNNKKAKCLIILETFAKVEPILLTRFVSQIQPFLLTESKSLEGHEIVRRTAHLLQLVIIHLENPQESFLSSLENSAIKLITQYDFPVIYNSMSLLSILVHNLTKNFSAVSSSFSTFYNFASNFRKLFDTELNRYDMMEELEQLQAPLKRSILLVGLFLRHFDLTDLELPETTIDDVYDMMMFFMRRNSESNLYTLKALGAMCLKHHELLFKEELKSIYKKLIIEESAPVNLKIQVLRNLEMILNEVERKSLEEDQNWDSKNENLKEMCDSKSVIGNSVAQNFTFDIFIACKHFVEGVRHAAYRIIKTFVHQGLVLPTELIPYLISMSVEQDQAIRANADKLLIYLDSKYPDFIHIKAHKGIVNSYDLIKITNKDCRGYEIIEETPVARNNSVYSFLKTKEHRRALFLSLLKEFEPERKCDIFKLVYFADNLAYLTYKNLDDILFVLHQINISVSSNFDWIQSVQNVFLKAEEFEEENEESLINRLPGTINLRETSKTTWGIHLLLYLKEHLKIVYAISDLKIANYSPMKTGKNISPKKSKKSTFHPELILNLAKNSTHENNEILIKQYLELKALAMKCDNQKHQD